MFLETLVFNIKDMNEVAMITQKTVLVLGAGASCHCGYPIGQALYDRILRDLETMTPDFNEKAVPASDRFGNYRVDVRLLKLGHKPEDIINFRQALLLADRPSIDKFLERREDLIEIGKICIAQALIPYENNKEITNRDGKNWYQLLFNELDSSRDQFHDNKLSIITFNYDRSLEHYLFCTVKHTYGIRDDHEVAQLLNSIPIVHVHGQLGLLDWQTKVEEEARSYGGPLTKANLIKASQNIKIIHEDVEKDVEFAKARELIKEAERVYFLGFGYDTINMERLNVKSAMKNQFVGTGIGVTPNLHAKVKMFFKSIDREFLLLDGTDIVRFFQVTRFY